MKTSKKILATVLAIIMIMCTGSVSFSSFAADGDSVTVGDVTYTVSNSCITKVTVKNNASLGNYEVPSKVGVIGINSIGEKAYANVSITTLTIPNAITEIGGNAFSNCGLTKVIFNAPNCNIDRANYQSPDGLPGYEAFYGNSKLTTFEFGSNVSAIPANVCTNITSLTTVIFDGKVTEIGDSAFGLCSALENIDMSTLTEIDNYAFYKCSSLTSVVLPKTVDIGNNAFVNCSNVKSVSFPKAEVIGEKAFAGTGITSLTIPNTVTEIGNNAFSNCALTKVVFNAPDCNIHRANYQSPDGLPGYEAFYGNTQLTTFEFGSDVSSIPANVCTNISSLTTVKFDGTVTEIGDSAFGLCSSLETVDMSNLTEIDDYAFYKCSSLKSVVLPKTVDIGNNAFANCSNVKSVSIPKAVNIGSNAFTKTGITTLEYPDTITKVGNGAFSNCSSLEKVIFDENVTVVPANACTDNKALTTVEFRGVVTEMGKNAFYNSTTPDEIIYAGTKAQWDSLKSAAATGNDSLFKCTNVQFGNIPAPVVIEGSGVQVVDNNNAFGGKDVKLNITKTASDTEADALAKDFAMTKLSDVGVYNITLTSGGKEIQPTAPVKVRIPYSGKVDDASKIKVFHYYYNAQNKLEAEKITGVTYTGGYLEFYTSHFSKFVVGVEDNFYGDINADGMVNSSDALRALQHSVGQQTLTGEAFTRGDVNKDSGINSSDALAILQFSVGSRDNFHFDK